MATTIGRHERKKKKREERRKLREEVLQTNRGRGLIDKKNMMISKTSSNIQTPSLPHELVVHNIFTRLPIESLMRFSCVCKLWNDSIIHSQGNVPHFLGSQKHPIIMFHFFNLGYRSSSQIDDHYFFYLKKEDAASMISEEKKSDSGGSVKLQNLVTIPNNRRNTPIGYCNGLVCLSMVVSNRRIIQIFNPNRRETLTFSPPIKVLQSLEGYGFGFDPLTREYKVVCMVKGLEYSLVYTLGSNSWREIARRDPPLPLIKYAKSAVYCDGALYWRYYRPNVILSFDLHEEKFQVLRIPVEWDWSEQIWVHFLEFKGCLCFARLENSGCENSYKVHLHILADKIKQVWIKETFSIPFRCERATRILCISDQVFLYWLCGECFLFYNLHNKAAKVVQFPGGRFSDKKHLNAFRGIRVDNYRLYSHMANFISLRNFASKGISIRDFDPSDPGLEGKSFIGKFTKSKTMK